MVPGTKINRTHSDTATTVVISAVAVARLFSRARTYGSCILAQVRKVYSL